jgi:hypothetical protein
MRQPIEVLLEWVATHMPEVERARRAFDLA